MSRRRRRAQLVARCYPASWRERYGEELVELLEDSYGDAAMSVRAVVDLARGGLRQRWRATALTWGVARGATPEDRARGGTLGVGVAWALTMLAGLLFAKFSEHWDALTPPSRRAVPGAAVITMQAAAVLGALACASTLVVSRRALVRVAARSGWSRVVRPLRPAAVALLVFAVTTGAVVRWAHHLSAAQRNGASARYTHAFLAWGALGAACVLIAVVAAARLAAGLEYSRHELRQLAAVDLLATTALGVVVASTVLWWVSLSGGASHFFAHSLGATGGVSLPMLLVVLAMILALALALWGTRRALGEVPPGALADAPA